jgi:hypothetical protein
MQCIIQGCPSEQSDIRALKVCHRAQHAPQVLADTLHCPYPILLPRNLPRFVSSSPRPLKVATATHNGHTLVHDRLSDPKVAVDPLPDAGGFGNRV